MKSVSSFTMTRDAALKNIFDKPSESASSNVGLEIIREEFLDNYGAFIDEHATDKENNSFKIVGERNPERLTYRSLSLSGWREIFLPCRLPLLKVD